MTRSIIAGVAFAVAGLFATSAYGADYVTATRHAELRRAVPPQKTAAERLAGVLSPLRARQTGGCAASCPAPAFAYDYDAPRVRRPRSTYDAWGNYRNATAPTGSQARLGYTGHQFDVESGLIYARGRYYDPEAGTFLSRDEMEGQVDDSSSLHRYSYGKNNPLRYTDPDGRRAAEAWEAEELARQQAAAQARTQSFEARPKWQQYLFRALGSSELKEAGHLQRNITARREAIERADPGEPVLEGSAANTGNAYVYNREGRAEFDLPWVPQYVTAGEASRAQSMSAGKAVAFSPLSAIAFTIADVSGAEKNVKEGLALSGGNVWEFAVGAGAGPRMSTQTEAVRIPGGLLENPRIPVLEIDASRMPNIAKNIASAQEAGHPSILNRETNPAAIRANRAAACAGFCGPGSPDEYPFASTQQGGSSAQVRGVPLVEQRRQGGVLSNFYKDYRIGQGDPFEVIVKPGGDVE